jgi:hypothetical protein
LDIQNFQIPQSDLSILYNPALANPGAHLDVNLISALRRCMLLFSSAVAFVALANRAETAYPEETWSTEVWRNIIKEWKFPGERDLGEWATQ